MHSVSTFGEDEPERRISAEDTVRRPPGPNAEYVRGLLKHLRRHEWPGAPWLLGVDEYGYDVFARYPGRAASSPYQPPAVWSDGSLARVARLLRQLHDLTVGTLWAGDAEVACHNDITPANTVYRDSPDGWRPCGFLNWDLAGPGRRVHDLAYACWRFLDLGPARSEPTGPARLMRLMCDSYELGRTDRADLVETVLWWQERILTEERTRLGLTEPRDGLDQDVDADSGPDSGSDAGPDSGSGTRSDIGNRARGPDSGEVRGRGEDTADQPHADQPHVGQPSADQTRDERPATGGIGIDDAPDIPSEAPATEPIAEPPPEPPLQRPSERPGRPPGTPDARPLAEEDGLTESTADIQAAIDWVREYGDILDAIVTARAPIPPPPPPPS